MNQTTIVINIGNSDNKLSQEEWFNFIQRIWTELYLKNWTVHFGGGSSAESPRQNYCWVIESSTMDDIVSILDGIRKEFRQDAIALTIGETVMIK